MTTPWSSNDSNGSNNDNPEGGGGGGGGRRRFPWLFFLPGPRVSPSHNRRNPGRSQATEATHLLHSSSASSIEDGLANDSPTALAVARRQRARQAWDRLRRHVRSGHVLLRVAAANNNNNNNVVVDKSATRAAAVAWIRRQTVEFSLTQCLAAVALYLTAAVICFSFLLGEHWTWIDSAYFAMITFTTIGYGDLAPDTVAARLFTSAFALTGIALLGIVLGIVGNHVVEAEAKALAHSKRLAQQRVLGWFDGGGKQKPTSHNNNNDNNKGPLSSYSSMHTDASETPSSSSSSSSQQEQPPTSPSNPLWELATHFGFVLVGLVVFALVLLPDLGLDVAVANDDDNATNTTHVATHMARNFANALYYAVVTASTVGYGDLVPTTQRGRLIGIFLCPLVVATMGHFLSTVASIIMESRRSSFQKEMEQKELSMQDLEIMDEDDDGQVTYTEFMEFMLVAMNKCDKEFLDEIRMTFARLDTDGTGILDKEDMVAAARSKLQRTTKKLQLSRYKQYLLQQARQARQGEMARQAQHQSSFWHEGLDKFLSASFSDPLADDNHNSTQSLLLG